MNLDKRSLSRITNDSFIVYNILLNIDKLSKDELLHDKLSKDKLSNRLLSKETFFA